MQTLSRKLHNRRGASMLIAMVFLLFCAFVGGSVLAAATANGSRIKALTTSEQDYLNQRSTAALLADELTPANHCYTRLTMHVKTTTLQRCQFKTEGNYYDPIDPEPHIDSVEYTFEAFKLPVNVKYTAMQQALLESATQRLISERSIFNTNDITLENFDYATGSPDKISSNYFLMKYGPEATVRITDPMENEVDATFRCAGEAGDYTFTLDFGDRTQLSLRMNGSHNSHVQTSPSEYVLINAAEKLYNEKVVTSETVIISWDDPVVLKGGIKG